MRARRCLCLCCYRGSRHGRLKRQPLTVRNVGNGAVVIVSARPMPRRAVSQSPTALRRVRVDRHSSSAGHLLIFGSINARWITNKLNDLLEIGRDLLMNFLFVVEAWHDADAVALRCL
jgi:hypothetical protein